MLQADGPAVVGDGNVDVRVLCGIPGATPLLLRRRRTSHRELRCRTLQVAFPAKAVLQVLEDPRRVSKVAHVRRPRVSALPLRHLAHHRLDEALVAGRDCEVEGEKSVVVGLCKQSTSTLIHHPREGVTPRKPACVVQRRPPRTPVPVAQEREVHPRILHRLQVLHETLFAQQRRQLLRRRLHRAPATQRVRHAAVGALRVAVALQHQGGQRRGRTARLVLALQRVRHRRRTVVPFPALLRGQHKDACRLLVRLLHQGRRAHVQRVGCRTLRAAHLGPPTPPPVRPVEHEPRRRPEPPPAHQNVLPAEPAHRAGAHGDGRRCLRRVQPQLLRLLQRRQPVQQPQGLEGGLRGSGGQDVRLQRPLPALRRDGGASVAAAPQVLPQQRLHVEHREGAAAAAAALLLRHQLRCPRHGGAQERALVDGHRFRVVADGDAAGVRVHLEAFVGGHAQEDPQVR
eukprot:Rhum_TRINITY_DN15306_c0_g1::Rhum_TRINITY_DN15306_c0_g1_i1::g.150179::m.150179